jgi:glycerol-3-phosphate acyltransferase PlsX
MGGDFAPVAAIEGAILAARELPPDDKIVLIGQESDIRSLLHERGCDAAIFDIVHASEVIEMGEHPTKALAKKTNSSISIGFHMLKHNEIDSFSSAGNSGAMLVGSIFSVNTIQGIVRPLTSAIFPQEDGGFSLLVDVGTNPDAKPDVFYQFGLIGSIYVQSVYQVPNPRVALLNIGHEEEKGNLTTQAAFQLMKDSNDFNFVGNIEGRDILLNKADVIVCDGFTGNIILKLAESFYSIMEKRNLVDDYIQRLNYENYGGTPILGINGTVIMGHGISNDIAIKNMVLLGRDVHNANIASKIKHALINLNGGFIVE